MAVRRAAIRLSLAAGVLLLLLPLAPAGAVTPAPAPPAAAEGFNVQPDPASTRKSKAGTLAELGTVQLGRPVRDGVLVRSSFTTPQEVLLYAADAQPAVGGGFGFSGRTDPQEQVGGWLALAQNRLTVPAGGAVLVPYVLTVPAGTEGGEYVGAVVAEPVLSGVGSGLTTSTRFAMAVYLRVPGGVVGATPGRGSPDGTIVVQALQPRFEGSKACPVVSYRNDSQDIVDPVVTVRTDGLVGGSSYTKERVGALLPGASAEVALPCLERPVGPGELEVELTSPRGGGIDTTPYTWLPVSFLFSLLLLLLLVAALLATFLRGMLRRKQDEPGPVSPDRALE